MFFFKSRGRFLLFVLALILFLCWYFAIGPSSGKPGNFYNKGENAVWLEHEWVDRFKTPEQIQSLVTRLSSAGMRFVYVHVGPIESDGGISPQRYPFANDFLKKARSFDSRMQFLAWMGQIRGKLKFQDAGIRSRIAETAQVLVDGVGFDGVHYDIEPLLDEDTDFLTLLEETRTKIGESRTISVALREMIPYFTGKILSYVLDVDVFNHPDFYQKIAKRSDQIVIMTYENTIRKAWIYRYFLKNEVIWVSRALAQTGAKIFIGLPTYDALSDTFYPEAENIENGLLGLIDGLNSWRTDEENFGGVALFRFGTTSPEEWEMYEKLF